MGRTAVNRITIATAEGIPRWAFEEVEVRRCREMKLEPNSRNIDVWIADPIGWKKYHDQARRIVMERL